MMWSLMILQEDAKDCPDISPDSGDWADDSGHGGGEMECRPCGGDGQGWVTITRRIGSRLP